MTTMTPTLDQLRTRFTQTGALDDERRLIGARIKAGDLRRENVWLAGWLGHPAVDGHAQTPPPMDTWLGELESTSTASMMAIAIGIGWATVSGHHDPVLAEALVAAETMLDTDACDIDATWTLRGRVLLTGKASEDDSCRAWTIHRALEIPCMEGNPRVAWHVTRSALTSARAVVPYERIRACVIASLLRDPGALRVFLDDARTPPPGWRLVHWPEEAIALLETGCVQSLSLDHDLGDPGDLRTGYSVLLWLEEAVATRGVEPPPELLVHSANGPARAKMLRAIESIRRLTSV